MTKRSTSSRIKFSNSLLFSAATKLSQVPGAEYHMSLRVTDMYVKDKYAHVKVLVYLHLKIKAVVLCNVFEKIIKQQKTLGKLVICCNKWIKEV